jgi:hypothetical protein
MASSKRQGSKIMNLEYDKNSGAEASDLAGRPTLSDPSFPNQVRLLAMAGLKVTTEQLAAFFDIIERIIECCQALNPEFCHAVREGRLLADGLVAEKLFECAVGYEWVEEQQVRRGTLLAKTDPARQRPLQVESEVLAICAACSRPARSA